MKRKLLEYPGPDTNRLAAADLNNDDDVSLTYPPFRCVREAVVTVRLMSDAKLARFHTLGQVKRGEMATADAVALLGLSKRHLFRLLDQLQTDGAACLTSRRRGRPSYRRQRGEL